MANKEFNYTSKEPEDLDISFFESEGFQMLVVIAAAICIISSYIK